GAEGARSGAREALEVCLQNRNRPAELHILQAEALEGLARLALASEPPRVEEAQALRTAAESELLGALRIGPDTPGLRERIEALRPDRVTIQEGRTPAPERRRPVGRGERGAP